MEELVQEENWTEILRQFDIAVPTEIVGFMQLTAFVFNPCSVAAVNVRFAGI